MTAASIKDLIEAELRTAMSRLGGDPLQPLTYDAFALAGASPELLAVVGSIDDTLSDDDLLKFLREINAGRAIIRDVIALR